MKNKTTTRTKTRSQILDLLLILKSQYQKNSELIRKEFDESRLEKMTEINDSILAQISIVELILNKR